MLDLRTIPTLELKGLIATCDALAPRNRYFEDLFVILSRVLLSTHETLEMSEYEESHLFEAVAFLKIAIDANENIPDDHAGKMFLKYSLTAALTELEKRARKQAIKQ